MQDTIEKSEIDAIKSLCRRYEPVGSRVTCVPAPTDTDEDFLLLVDDGGIEILQEVLLGANYVRGGSQIPDCQNIVPAESRFVSYTCGTVNLIITTSEVFFARFMAATAVARRLNLLSKADRIALFQAVLYGNAEGVTA